MKMRLLLSSCLTAMLVGTTLAGSAPACTDFQITATDGSVAIGRSMEFGIDMQSRLLTHNRGQHHTSSSPSGKPGLSWNSKYGYVAADSLNLGFSVDGMNEQGLSFGCLWFPGAKYPDVSAAQSSSAINATDFGDWILGNFSTVGEVRSALAKVKVWAGFIPQLQQTPPVHFAIHDAQGHNLVVEFIDGQQKIYDNPNGVLTNAPDFAWHTTNLRNYIHLSAGNPQPIKIEGTVLAPPGQGGGFLGIPGDWTPPSRFVRTTAMLQFAKPATNAAEAANLAAHILNAVDIPLGAVRENATSTSYSDYTQWVVIKDLTNKVLYFRTYDNLSLRSIDLKSIDLKAGALNSPVPMTNN
jgi:choloylglycine hydrolase